MTRLNDDKIAQHGAAARVVTVGTGSTRGGGGEKKEKSKDSFQPAMLGMRDERIRIDSWLALCYVTYPQITTLESNRQSSDVKCQAR